MYLYAASHKNGDPNDLNTIYRWTSEANVLERNQQFEKQNCGTCHDIKW